MSRIESKPSMVSHRLELDERFSCSPSHFSAPIEPPAEDSSRRRQPETPAEDASRSGHWRALNTRVASSYDSIGSSMMILSKHKSRSEFQFHISRDSFHSNAHDKRQLEAAEKPKVQQPSDWPDRSIRQTNGRPGEAPIACTRLHSLPLASIGLSLDAPPKTCCVQPESRARLDAMGGASKKCSSP